MEQRFSLKSTERIIDSYMKGLWSKGLLLTSRYSFVIAAVEMVVDFESKDQVSGLHSELNSSQPTP